MDVSGTGINSTAIKIKPGFKIDTRLAIDWFQLSNGNWAGTDRGSDSDIYEADVDFYGTQSDMEEIINLIEDNRATSAMGANALQLSNINTSEKIFGEDIDYSGGVYVTTMETGRVQQKTWKGYTLSAKLRLLSPSFTGSASLPSLSCVNIGYKAYADWTINKYDSYKGNMEYMDHASDAGIFEGVFRLSISDMVSMRRYIATQRTSSYTITAIDNLSEMFGTRRGGSFSYTAKLIDWEDLGLNGLQFYFIRLKFAEVI